MILFHIGVETADLSVERVKERVHEGGHPVPDEKIRQRFERNGPLIREAMLLCDQGHVFDNSRLNVPPRKIIGFSSGRVTFAAPMVPAWARAIYGQDLVV